MEQQQLFPIYGMVHTPFWAKTWFYALIIAGILILLALFVWYGIKRVWYARQVRTPYQQLHDQLDLIEQAASVDDPDMIDGQELYIHLTDCIKLYCHNQYGINCLGATDAELTQLIAHTGELQKLERCLQALSQSCLYVKFADHQPVVDELLGHIEQVRRSVEQDAATQYQ